MASDDGGAEARARALDSLADLLGVAPVGQRCAECEAKIEDTGYNAAPGVWFCSRRCALA